MRIALVAIALAARAAAFSLVITMVADPNDSSSARFVELYSSDGAGQSISQSIGLTRWTNGNAAATSSAWYDLNGKTIGADGICPDPNN